MAEEDASKFPSAADYGRSLKGFGVNLLVGDIARTLPFLTEVLGIQLRHRADGFAVLSYQGCQWMLHEDSTYHSNPLLGLTGDGAIRGIGVELRLYNIDPDEAEARAREGGYTVLQGSTNKPHGLRECYLVDPDGYVWVPGVAIGDEKLPKSQ
ncbi:MAG: VOC family protein [Kiloniellales bacterium]|nr:VOC family protein [Kiloniellales bacterium]